MNITPVEFAIVVVGQDCNPTILNPDFLRCRDIVPEDWGWEVVGPAITTPPFATVAYDSGVTIKVEPNRFQVADTKNVGDIGHSKAQHIAEKYISVLPHVRYTGVGINFRALVQVNQPDSFLKHHFLKDAPWVQQNPPIGINLKLVYTLDDGKLNLSLEGGRVIRRVKERPEELEGILCHGNYHRDCRDYPADRLVIEHLHNAEHDRMHFDALLTTLLSNETD